MKRNEYESQNIVRVWLYYADCRLYPMLVHHKEIRICFLRPRVCQTDGDSSIALLIQYVVVGLSHFKQFRFFSLALGKPPFVAGIRHARMCLGGTSQFHAYQLQQIEIITK